VGKGHRTHVPLGRISQPDQRGAPPLLKKEGREVGGKLATQVRALASSPVVSAKAYPEDLRWTEARAAVSTKKSAEGMEEVCAQSVEFVAVPDVAASLQATLPGALRSALQKAEGFAGCAVMVSEQEARLVTVVTFWRGKDRGRLANENAQWVEQLLDPYIDRQLRTHRLRAQIALQSETQTQSMKSDELMLGSIQPNEATF